MKTEDKPYLTTKEAAQILGYAEQTMHQSRNTGVLGGTEAPPFIKRGRMVRYVREELDAWLKGGIWAVYDLDKSKIPMGISTEEYDKQIKVITKRLGI
jgi:predicted DNA-binding transcriptional regulator AlpA